MALLLIQQTPKRVHFFLVSLAEVPQSIFIDSPEFMLFVEGNPVWLMSKLTMPLPLMGVSPLRYSRGVVLKRKWVT